MQMPYSMDNVYMMLYSYSRRMSCENCSPLNEFEHQLYENLSRMATEHARTQTLAFRLHHHRMEKDNAKEILEMDADKGI